MKPAFMPYKSFLLICLGINFMLACKPNSNPAPSLTLTQGIYSIKNSDTTYYTFKTDTAYVGDTVIVGITAEKTEDLLERFNISFSQTANSLTTLYYSKVLDGDEAKLYKNDFFLKMPNMTGKLFWTVNVIDADGNKGEQNFEVFVK